MSQRLADLVRGNEIATAVAVAAVLGLAVSLVPVLERPLLLLASTGLLLVVAALAIWLLRSHREVEWTTSGGTPERVRGSDRRVTSLSRTIDAALTGDEAARADVRELVRSAAEASLTAQRLAPTPTDDATRAALGPALTAYLTSATPRPVTTDELASFITTLEEH
ncbi:hypothetical protein GCM10022415_32420 [Knoellia locipacati]|uniref:Uncharacterized protein n=1 Tax=Knoellia locipacati TaxID=882824 RepID=A0A512T3H2_9MICO|nr:hypothetical protein [Knoellia locipacati]GEQ14754.1 hypothetical protein KLO01_28010 [Knoellia locipacati]